MVMHQILRKDDQVCLAQILKAGAPLSANLEKLLECLTTALAHELVLQWDASNLPAPEDNSSWQPPSPASPHVTSSFISDLGASWFHENNPSHNEEAGVGAEEVGEEEGEVQAEEAQEEEVQEEETQEEEVQERDVEVGWAGEAGRERRGTKKKSWRDAKPYAPKLHRGRHPKVPGGDTVEAMVAELGTAHPLSESFNPEVWLEEIKQGLARQEVPKSASTIDSLHCIINRCFFMTGQDVTANFLLMVNYINLVAQCQSIQLNTGFSLSQIYRDFVVPMGRRISLRSFQKWHSAGTKFAALAGGGTIYVLVLIASLGLRTSIASMTGQGPWDLANTLRCPDKSTSAGKMIIDRVIPAVHAIQWISPLTMESLFLTNRLALHQLPKDGDFGSSDRFFNWIVFNNFTLVSRSSEWNIRSASGGASTSSDSTTPTSLLCSLPTDRMVERLASQAEDVQMAGDTSSV